MRLLRPSVLPAALVLLATAAAASTRPVDHPAPPPTFSKEVVRIFQASCQTCHHPGDIGPFSLMDHASAAPMAPWIKAKTAAREMPPWKPSLACSHFEGERRLADADIATLGRWADAGAPEGNPADLPPLLEFPDGWAAGEPDLVLSMAASYTPPSSADMYRCFPVEPTFERDRHVSMIEVRPGAREQVHHVIGFIDATNASAALDAADAEPGYPCFGGPGFTTTGTVGGWAPGSRPVELPERTGLLVPKGAKVVLQIHYHPHGGHVVPDRTEVGLHFAAEPVAKEVYILPLINRDFVLPAGDPDAVVTASFTSPLAATLLATAPHMHLLGRSMRVEATRPDGSVECLVDVPDWDFRWQSLYRYAAPIPIPAGTKLTLEAHYDNSAGNPENPNDPPREVRWGEATTDEMCIVFFALTLGIDAESAVPSGGRER